MPLDLGLISLPHRNILPHAVFEQAGGLQSSLHT